MPGSSSTSEETDQRARREQRAFPWIQNLLNLGGSTLLDERRVEVRVNLWRMGVLVLVLVVLAAAFLIEGGRPGHPWSLAASLAALAYSLALFPLLRLPGWIRTLRYVTVTLDVSLVTLMLAATMAGGRAVMATNSQVTFLLYFLVLALIASRHNPRLALYGAALVLVQYAVLIAVGQGLYHVTALPPDPDYGAFLWSNQIGRFLVLLAAAAMTVGVVSNARRLREISIRDSLTGVYNRRYFLEVLRLEHRYCVLRSQPMTVVMMDIDGFKAFNDANGHLRGDGLLVAVADYLLRSLRRSDVVARYGGDEFVLLLLETPPAEACETLLRIQQNMQQWMAASLPGATGSVSLSFGMASLSSVSPQEPMALVETADRHLYAAKRDGGGAVCDEEGRVRRLAEGGAGVLSSRR